MDSSVFQNKIFFLSFSPLNAFQKNTMLYSTVNLKFSITRVTLTGKKKKRHKYISTNQNYKPLHESSSIGCLKAVMSLKVQRNKTTLSCSFRIGAIFTKNHTGVPERNIKRLVSNLPSHLRGYGSEDLGMNRHKYSFIFFRKLRSFGCWGYYTINFSSFWNKIFHSDYSVMLFFCSINFLSADLLTLVK